MNEAASIRATKGKKKAGRYSSTIVLLRFHFSLFLMPLYWFALSQLVHINWLRAILIFIILHFLVYPASNGYNSFMDRDSGSIGGIKNPPEPSNQLFYFTILMDALAILLSLFISPIFAAAVLLYILASKAYSYRGIRLKKFPVIGFLTVAIFQGALVFFMVFHGADSNLSTEVPVSGMLAATLLIGGVYPLTQIYQHQQDLEDGVVTLSYKLGFLGSFIFSGIIYTLAFGTLGYLYFSTLEWNNFFLLMLFMLPVIAYFIYWFNKTRIDRSHADFEHAMLMNIIASTFTNLGFITILIKGLLE